jgi:hypothetical protein
MFSAIVRVQQRQIARVAYSLSQPAVMDEQLDFLQSIVRRLNAVGIPYMLTGSLALSIWARPRMTRDVDVVIDADLAAVSRLLLAFAADCYASPEAAADAVSSRTMFNVIHHASLLKADFILRKEEPYEREKFARRRTVDLAGLPIDVISPEDLILSKLQWRRETASARQAEDVRVLLAEVEGIDHEYLRRWASVLDLTAALDTLQA